MSQQTFRSALNGFNRDDVVHYIEFINAQHAAEVAQLKSELEFLHGKAQQPAVEEKVADCQCSELVEQQAARIRELFDLCKEKDEAIAKLTAQLENAAPKSPVENELEAYRRAERTERMAQERAEQIYRRANAVLADATVKVDEAAAMIAQMADQAAAQLGNFQNAMTDAKQILCSAVSAMGTICPESDND